MQVILSRSSFAEVLRDLRGSGSICIPSAVVPDFVAFAASFGVVVCGGCLMKDYDNTVCQWLYID